MYVLAFLQLDRLLQTVFSQDFVLRSVWVGLVTLTVALLVLMRTRWGEAQPLRKCLFLSVLAHLLMAGYATTVTIVASARPAAEDAVVSLSSINTVYDAPNDEAEDAAQEQARPWEQFPSQNVPRPDVSPAERLVDDDPGQLMDRQNQEPLSALPEQAPAEAELPAREQTAPQRGALAEAVAPTPQSAADVPQQIETVEAQRQEAAPLATPDSSAGAARPDVATPLPELQRPDPALLPSQMLDRPRSLPQLADVPRTDRPAELAPGPVDVLTPRTDSAPAQPAPLDSAAPQVPSESAPADVAAGTVPQRMTPQSLAPPAITPLPQAAPGASRLADSRSLPTPSALDPAPLLDGQGRMPALYRLRVAPDRAEQAQRRGATAETEAAVNRALQWLSRAQSPDGRWDASRYSAGREQRIDGHDRGGAGSDADTAMTGLALLAFLGAGHTHQTGSYQQVVAAGLEFLRSQQATDGNLAGEARNFARMYSHGIATLSVSEAYAMTADRELEPVVNRAIAYSLAAQNPTSGGWRYHPWRQQPGDRGDTSQLGWQLMALKSAELAGVTVPQTARDGMVRFLNDVSAGSRGGLACYRPGERITHPMTAEALACRQFLGMTRSNPASDEAGDYLLGSLPGSGRANLYYWYYGTLAMYQLQGRHWRAWNDALQRTLLPLQGSDGAWPADTVWGGYGGQIYTTALGTLCLEVYYRYLPLYSDPAAGGIR